MSKEEHEGLGDNDESGSRIIDKKGQGTDEGEQDLNRPSQVKHIIDESKKQDEANSKQGGVVGAELKFVGRRCKVLGHVSSIRGDDSLNGQKGGVIQRTMLWKKGWSKMAHKMKETPQTIPNDSGLH